MDLLSKYGMTQNYKIRETRVSWVNWCGWIEFVIHKDLTNKKNHLISLITLFGKKWRIRTLWWGIKSKHKLELIEEGLHA